MLPEYHLISEITLKSRHKEINYMQNAKLKLENPVYCKESNKADHGTRRVKILLPTQLLESDVKNTILNTSLFRSHSPQT